MSSTDRRDTIELALRPFYRTEETRSNIARWIARGSERDRRQLAASIYSGFTNQRTSNHPSVSTVKVAEGTR